MAGKQLWRPPGNAARSRFSRGEREPGLTSREAGRTGEKKLVVKGKGGELGSHRCGVRWFLLVARSLPSTLDAVYSSYLSTHSSLGSAGPLALDGKH